MIAFFLCFTLALAAVFWLVYRRNKTHIGTGFLFLGTLASAAVTYFIIALYTQQQWMVYPMLAAAMLLLLVLFFGVYVAIALLLLNARLVFKRERRSLANSLTLLLALGLIVLLVVRFAINTLHSNNITFPLWLDAILSGVSVTLAFYLVHVLVFLTSVLLCNLARPKKTQSYIIVLGSGLISGKVPPLLAARINKAITFYNKQKATHAPPKLVMSGGQGADEPRPEAEAMAEYAMDKGIPKEHILIESKSKNTMENMAFSKTVMDEDSGGKPYTCIYATNNYHLLRAGIYARAAGLKADGIGARTALYYLPNALLREYIAFVSLHKTGAIIGACIGFFGGVFLRVFPEAVMSYVSRINITSGATLHVLPWLYTLQI